MITTFGVIYKNEMRYSQQAESSAIRFLQIAEAFCRVAAQHVHTKAADLYPDERLAVSLIAGQHAIYF